MKRLFLVISIFVICSAVYAQNRYALVIGNNEYRNGVSKLLTPVNDANDVSAVLRTLGYETVLKTNIGIDDLDDAINQFIVKLNNNSQSEGFFWFAGHGLNIESKHYLLPIDVNPRTEDSIVRGSLSVDKLADRFERVKNKANLLVLDACRNDSLPGQRSVSGRGLAVVSLDTVGNVITYSTRAGQTADDGNPGDRNSPFAAAFINNIKTAESYDNLFIQIANDTRTRTNGKQQPYKVGYFNIKNYSIALTPASQPAPTPVTQPQSSNTTQTAKFFCDRGVQFSMKGDQETAIADFTEAIRIDSNYKEAYYGRGFAYQIKKDYDRAIADYTQAIRIDSNNKYYYNFRGVMYRNKNDYDLAIVDFTQAVRIDPNYWESFFNRGDVYRTKKDYDRAIADYTQVIRIYPNFKEAYRIRGYTYYIKKDYDRAIADYEAALKIDPDFSDAKYNLEDAREARGY